MSTLADLAEAINKEVERKTSEMRLDYERLKEYCVALERTRADLWSQNEELRAKCEALELGQSDLITHMLGQGLKVPCRRFERHSVSGSSEEASAPNST